MGRPIQNAMSDIIQSKMSSFQSFHHYDSASFLGLAKHSPTMILFLLEAHSLPARSGRWHTAQKIKVLCEQTRVANKRIRYFFGLCLILFGFGNIVTDFHV